MLMWVNYKTDDLLTHPTFILSAPDISVNLYQLISITHYSTRCQPRQVQPQTQF